MSKINELIQTLCPDGVEYKKLGEVGMFYGGITGKSKADFENGNAKFISYKNVYSNFAVDQNTSDRVMMREDENQRSLQYGDICFTGSSETPDECGFSAVVTSVPVEPLYLNSFSFFFRFYDLNGINPDYMKYLFRSSDLRYQIGKTAKGVTRFNVSKELMRCVVIPIPPLPVQEEIVRILDEYTELEAELEAKLSEEIKLKQKQYEVYRDELLTFGDDVEYKKLGEVATISRGNGFQKKDFTEVGRPCIHYGQIFMHYSKMGITTSKTLTCIDDDKYEKNAKALPNDIVMAVTSENVEDVCKCVVWEGDEPVAVSGHTAIFHTEMNSKFLAYWFGSSDFYVQKVRLAHGTKVIEVTPAAMVDIVLPVPSLTEQERIVKILDKYDIYTRDMISILNTELKSRKKQYAYYRDQLLTFKRKE